MSILGDIATARTATADLVRRAAVVAVARASAQYQPSSQQDAVRVRDLVVGLIESEMDVAGDAGQDDTYNALRKLRQAVVADLAARGASLAQVETFNLNDTLPDLALANWLYGDVGRADGLVRQVNPQHPSFFPHRFRALAS